MYDILIGAIEAFIRYGISPTALFVAILALLKSRKVKNRLRRYIPWIMNDGDIANYEARQIRIEQKIDALLESEGIHWSANTTEPVNPSSLTRRKIFFIMLWPGNSIARSAELHTVSKNGGWTTMRKFKSRKFWMAVISALLVILNEGLDLGIDEQTVLAFAGIIMSFIFGEAYVDGKRAEKEVPNEPDYSQTDFVDKYSA